MAAIPMDEMRSLLLPYMAGAEAELERPGLIEKLSVYLDLLLRWNERTNLTAIRDPKSIVQRHFGESLFVARHVSDSGSLLDLGSGAGFPGLPIQLWHVGLKVTLAESQGKKAAFLREVVRSLSLESEVWQGRAEELSPLLSFDAVVMRAVDKAAVALRVGATLSRGDLWVLGSQASLQDVSEAGIVSRYLVPLLENSSLFRLDPTAFHVERSGS